MGYVETARYLLELLRGQKIYSYVCRGGYPWMRKAYSIQLERVPDCGAVKHQNPGLWEWSAISQVRTYASIEELH